MDEQITLLEKEIMMYIPQIPYVVDQVGAAINWVKEEVEEGKLHSTLSFALSVAKYAASVSEPNFYKTQLVIAALLMDIKGAKEDTRFAVFKTASNIVETALDAIVINEDLVKERGCFKAITIHAVQLAGINEDYFTVFMLGILQDLNDILEGMKKVGVKSPITPEDYIQVAGYALVMANMRMSGLSLLNTTREEVNKIEIILNSELNY